MRDAWVHGRVGTALCTDWPWDCAAVIRVDHTTPLVDEEWTLTLRNVLPDGSSFVFDLKGSVTGPDGTGVSDRDFLSDSGRVQIAAADWWLAESYKLFGRKFPATVVMKWRPIALHANAVRPRADRQRVVLVAGVENRPHTLTLERAGEGPLPFVTLTVYKPAR